MCLQQGRRIIVRIKKKKEHLYVVNLILPMRINKSDCRSNWFEYSLMRITLSWLNWNASLANFLFVRKKNVRA